MPTKVEQTPEWDPDNPQIETWTKKQLANAYGRSVKWLVSKLKQAEIETGRSRTLSPNHIKRFFEVHGAPTVKPSWIKHEF